MHKNYLLIYKSLSFIRRVLICSILLVSFSLNIMSNSSLPGGFSHIIEVTRYSDYGKGFLTIIDDNVLIITEHGRTYINCYTYEYVNEYKEDWKKHLENGDLILEVDGISAEGWSKEQFYSIVDGRDDIITLKIRSKRDGEITDFETKIQPLKELPDGMKAFGDIFATIVGETATQRRKNIKFTYEERHDEDFDFFPCLFYDYLITSDDPLLDKEILKKVWLPNLERNEEKPDLLITIARDANESINTTYIPPSSRIVNDGSTTVTRYNYLTKQNDYITKQKNRVIHEGGYTQETKTADIFLELAALDVRKLNDKSSTHPPIVWKTTANRHVVNPTFNLNEELKTYATWMDFPPCDRQVYAERTLWAPSGIIVSDVNQSIIQDVIKGSRAEQIGLLPGDIIEKVKVQNKYQQKTIKKDLKKKGWRVLDYFLEDNYIIIFSRNGERMVITLPPLMVKISRNYFEAAK